MRTRSNRLMMTTFGAAILGVSAFVWIQTDGPARLGARPTVDAATTVELGQFSAPTTRADGARGVLMIQARAAVASQDAALALSRETPAIRHAALRSVHGLGLQGEASLSVDEVAAELTSAVNIAFGAPIAETVYIDRLLVQ